MTVNAAEMRGAFNAGIGKQRHGSYPHAGLSPQWGHLPGLRQRAIPARPF